MEGFPMVAMTRLRLPRPLSQTPADRTAFEKHRFRQVQLLDWQPVYNKRQKNWQTGGPLAAILKIAINTQCAVIPANQLDGTLFLRCIKVIILDNIF